MRLMNGTYIAGSVFVLSTSDGRDEPQAFEKEAGCVIELHFFTLCRFRVAILEFLILNASGVPVRAQNLECGGSTNTNRLSIRVCTHFPFYTVIQANPPRSPHHIWMKRTEATHTRTDSPKAVDTPSKNHKSGHLKNSTLISPLPSTRFQSFVLCCLCM